MKTRIALFPLLLIATAIWALPERAESDGPIPYPEGYRKWVHVSSTVVGPQSPFFAGAGGIHHIYANEPAMKGYETGKFPDGAILVFDLLDTKENNGATVAGPRKRIDVMIKDARRFANSGGWGFERFMGDNKTDRALTDELRAQCVSCHARQKAQDYVFSTFRW